MSANKGDSKSRERREAALFDMMLGPAIALAGWMAGVAVSYGTLSSKVEMFGWMVKIAGVVAGAGLFLRGVRRWRG